MAAPKIADSRDDLVDSHDEGSESEEVSLQGESPSESDEDGINTAETANGKHTTKANRPSGKKYQRRILDAYRSLQSRRVDLVGDYAGNELFIIDGDSLLLRCFSDSKLDFDPGFQLLHATYNVEHFLHQLVKRKCNFQIVFFESNKQLCVPPTARPEVVGKYLFARVAIIRHLETNLDPAQSGITIHRFQSCESTDFASYMADAAPYFVMLHDGAAPVDRKAKHMNQTQEDAQRLSQRLGLREMILSFVLKGYNIALINGLEWRDTKVITMVLETRRRIDLPMVQVGEAAGKPNKSIDVEAMVEKLGDLASQMSERQMLATTVISELLQGHSGAIDKANLERFSSAFLLHQALLEHAPLSARRCSIPKDSDVLQQYISAFSATAESVLASAGWEKAILDHQLVCDVGDTIDGRLFIQTFHQQVTPSSDASAALKQLTTAVNTLCGIDLPSHPPLSKNGKPTANGHTKAPESVHDTKVLPFSNPVFDKHLVGVRLQIDDKASGRLTPASSKVFREVTHWHNAKKPLIPKGPATAASTKAAFWAAKRNQMFMAEMQKYAASLTNAVGRSLEPESIIVGTTARDLTKPIAQNEQDSDSTDSSSVVLKEKNKQKKGGAGGKNAAKTAGKQAMLNQIAASKAKKDEVVGDKIVGSWTVACKGIDADVDPRSRYMKGKQYLSSLQPAWKDVLGTECELYMVNALLTIWIEACRRQEKHKRTEITALIWSHISKICQGKNLTKDIMSSVEMTVKTLGLPPPVMPSTSTLPQRKLAFTFVLPSKVTSLSTNVQAKEYQLRFGGPYLERSFDSAPDGRVDFHPDGWQRKVLDGIDADKSLFVVAPTSSGKTFISFYAMRKVLEADDDSILVYVAPTKALVNQIAAEIQSRYSKKFKYGGKSVWAIHTRDYRINNPTGCQVLVTVPHVLQIMLMAPTNANSWSSRVKRIIFDEVHSIGQAEDGVVWEQLLLLAPCPIIALSATVGNPTEFSEWLATTQKAIGVELLTVQWPHRYSDLRKYYYVPPKQFRFQGLPDKTAFGTLGIEHATGLNRVHPVGALVDKSRGMPEDLALEPWDCLDLWRAMVKHQRSDYPVPQDLDPDQTLPDTVRKADILLWERRLKAVLREWMRDEASPYELVQRELEQGLRDEKREPLQTTRSDNPEISADNLERDELIQTTLPMLCRLHEQDALPAILFNYDRHMCEKICRTLLEQLTKAEYDQEKSGGRWERKLEKFEEWKKLKEKTTARNAKATSRKSATKSKDDIDDGDKTSKLDQQRDAGGSDVSPWETFDPDAPVENYHFADYTKVQKSDMELYTRQLRRREVQAWLIDGLKRGVGIHHAGMNRKYRQVVEILFRKGFLRVVVATGTLALGINMPCKTVVFSGDSVFLTALNYRQCAGRAGRRGFDLLGNVVFQGISREKVCRLISSRLPDLNGHFPITTTLVLRLFTLLTESKNSKYAVSAINALLTQPRLYMGGPSFKDQTMHHLRFSIEYLRRQSLLGSNGAPLNFAGLVSHLYFTENSSFAFHALLKEGYFHELCEGIKTNEKDTLETLMLVMAHLFNRMYCRQSDEEYKETVVKPSSSIVFLPALPRKAAKILRDHNQQTLDVYTQYADTFAEQHIDREDNVLPLTGFKVGGDGESVDGLHALPTPRVRSAFVALSGAGDKFDSISDLCQTARDGIFLEEAVVPHVGIYPDGDSQPLNAWLLDFLKHGDVKTLERANGIRRADVWFLLNDFSLVLATIIASLMNFMKLKEGSDLDMLDVMGNLDAHEEAEDENAAASEEQSEVSGPSVADSAIVLPDRGSKPVTKKKAKNTDSWEELADEEDAEVASKIRDEAEETGMVVDEADVAWEGEGGGEGLRNVLKAFSKLHAEFTVKFRAMWA